MHPVLFVFAQKIDKFWFVVNVMRTVYGWRSTGSQSHPHIHAFGSQTIRKRFVNHSVHLCTRGFRCASAFDKVWHLGIVHKMKPYFLPFLPTYLLVLQWQKILCAVSLYWIYFDKHSSWRLTRIHFGTNSLLLVHDRHSSIYKLHDQPVCWRHKHHGLSHIVWCSSYQITAISWQHHSLG